MMNREKDTLSGGQRALRVLGWLLVILTSLLAVLFTGFGSTVQAVQTAPRFADTELPAEPDDMANRGELQVSGVLRTSPCMADGMTGPDGALYLVLHGCGDGITRTGRARLQEVPVPATVRLGDVRQAVRLHGGVNRPATGVLPRGGTVEVSYE